MYRAAASNAYHMGADGFYLFNLFCRGYPLGDDAYVVMRDTSAPDALRRRDKRFMSAPPGERWDPAADALPAKLPYKDETVTASVFVGDDIDACRKAGMLRRAELRLVLADLADGDRFRFSLNGETLPPEAIRTVMTSDRELREWRARTAASFELQTLGTSWAAVTVDLTDRPIRHGRNHLTVRRLDDDTDREFAPRLIRVEIDVQYEFCGRAAVVESSSLM